MKQFLPFLLLLSIITSCKYQNQSNMQHEENQNLITQYFTHFNNHEWTKLAAMYADSVECKDPTLGLGIAKQTGQQLAGKYGELHGIFADINDKVIQMYPSGDKHVIVEFISTGSAPDGTAFELPICTIFTIENGKITKDFTYYDNFDEEQKSEENAKQSGQI